jgi:hypothetical protein
MRGKMDDYLSSTILDPEYCAAYDRELKTFRRGGMYRRRFQWWYPWNVVRWWQPRWFQGSDEWCNDSICFVMPPFGCLVIFWRPGRLRTLPCEEDWRYLDELARADYAPCGYLRNGCLNRDSHHHQYTELSCDIARTWLSAGRSERNE